MGDSVTDGLAVDAAAGEVVEVGVDDVDDVEDEASISRHFGRADEDPMTRSWRSRAAREFCGVQVKRSESDRAPPGPVVVVAAAADPDNELGVGPLPRTPAAAADAADDAADDAKRNGAASGARRVESTMSVRSEARESADADGDTVDATRTGPACSDADAAADDAGSEGWRSAAARARTDGAALEGRVRRLEVGTGPGASATGLDVPRPPPYSVGGPSTLSPAAVSSMRRRSCRPPASESARSEVGGASGSRSCWRIAASASR